jgi:hypothetical protein
VSLDAAAAAHADGQPLACFRHPDRETFVSCGRCDRPICTRCGMLGPVGLRCRDCGKPPRDPLTSLAVIQLLAGSAAALGAGTIGAFICLQIGLLAICLGIPVGGLIGEAVMRATGYKHGPIVRGVVVLGIIGGLVVAAALQYGLWFGGFGAAPVPLDSFLPTVSTGGTVYLIAAFIGAFARLR